MAGLKYRWKIAPKKSYSCSLIAHLQVSDDASIVRPYRQLSNADQFRTERHDCVSRLMRRWF
jgi:hypothetical protein